MEEKLREKINELIQHMNQDKLERVIYYIENSIFDPNSEFDDDIKEYL